MIFPLAELSSVVTFRLIAHQIRSEVVPETRLEVELEVATLLGRAKLARLVGRASQA
jgi:hypothetical protein